MRGAESVTGTPKCVRDTREEMGRGGEGEGEGEEGDEDEDEWKRKGGDGGAR